MATERRVRRGGREPLVVVADPDPQRRDLLRVALDGAARTGREAPAGGSAPRYRLRFAQDCEEAARLVTPDVSALAVNLSAGRSACVRMIESLRPSRPDLAVLCYVTAAPRAEAMAAMMAGADHVVEWGEGHGLGHALDVALDRRSLTLLVERSAADLEDARRRLSRLGPSEGVLLPGLRPPPSAEAVLPFHAAVRHYLLACSRLFEGDARGLADRLGVSYFALRRLLKRYSVPFPGRATGARRARPHGGSGSNH